MGTKLEHSLILIPFNSLPVSVDLRLHGIDEVLVGPLSKTIVRQKYMKWTSVQTVHGETPSVHMYTRTCSERSWQTSFALGQLMDQ